jgi:hypothetical protein
MGGPYWMLDHATQADYAEPTRRHGATEFLEQFRGRIACFVIHEVRGSYFTVHQVEPDGCTDENDQGMVGFFRGEVFATGVYFNNCQGTAELGPHHCPGTGGGACLWEPIQNWDGLDWFRD